MKLTHMIKNAQALAQHLLKNQAHHVEHDNVLVELCPAYRRSKLHNLWPLGYAFKKHRAETLLTIIPAWAHR